MDIESLLNPTGESHVLTEMSDHEIYWVVMDAINAQENIKINSRDDVDNDLSSESCPTHQDILKAASVVPGSGHTLCHTNGLYKYTIHL